MMCRPKSRSTIIILLMPLLLALSNVLPVSAHLPFASLANVKIAYDLSHDTGRQWLTSPTGGNANSRIFGDFTSRGATISTITSFTLPILQQFDVLWLEEDFAQVLSAHEQAVLAAFVASGKGVIICCDSWSVYTSEPGSPYKVFNFGYTPGQTYDFSFPSGITTNITPHPVTNGVSAAYVEFAENYIAVVPPEATKLVLSPDSSASSTRAPSASTCGAERSQGINEQMKLFDAGHGNQQACAGSIAASSAPLTMVAIRSFGAGRVVTIGDELCFDFIIEQADNVHLCNQLMDYAAGKSVIDVAVDIKPGSCPNPFNTNAKGVLPVAILGTSGLDVAKINPATVRLAGVAPLRWAREDVATPFTPFIGKASKTDCTSSGADGRVDLTLKFDSQAISAALGSVADRQVRVLSLSGTLKPEFGSTPIRGEDVIVIIKKK